MSSGKNQLKKFSFSAWMSFCEQPGESNRSFTRRYCTMCIENTSVSIVHSPGTMSSCKGDVTTESSTVSIVHSTGSNAFPWGRCNFGRQNCIVHSKGAISLSEGGETMDNNIVLFIQWSERVMTRLQKYANSEADMAYLRLELKSQKSPQLPGVFIHKWL